MHEPIASLDVRQLVQQHEPSLLGRPRLGVSGQEYYRVEESVREWNVYLVVFKQPDSLRESAF
jgi:hypothetical protein